MSEITKIIFKDEGDLDGEPIGPVALILQQRDEVPYGWLRLSQAKRIAESYGLVLERF